VEVKFTRDTSAVAGQPGTAATQNGLMAGSMVSIGKYLTPRLYVSFGRYLFSEQSVVKLRYKFSEKWEVETHGGTVSGATSFTKSSSGNSCCYPQVLNAP
jgi:translocation and assembly module TamB